MTVTAGAADPGGGVAPGPLLALDTSGAVSVAVHDGQQVVAARHVHDPRRHAELLLPFVAAVLAEVGIDRRSLRVVAVGTGPGPFTGLRVGLVTARALGLALGIAVHGVPSLDALALQVAEKDGDGSVAPGGEYVVATDARRREVYWARYRAPSAEGGRDTAGQGLPVLLSGPAVSRPADVPLEGAPCFGRGAVAYPELLHPGAALGGQLLDPGADALARIAVQQLGGVRGAAGVGHVQPTTPLYLRRPDAVEPGQVRRGRRVR